MITLVHLPEIKTVDNVDYFILENDPDVEFYDNFKTIFGNDEFFIIAFKKDSIFINKNLTTLSLITEKLEELDEIKEIKSIANVNTTRGEQDFFIVEKLLEDLPQTREQLSQLKKTAMTNPIYNKNIISMDGMTAAIMVMVYEKPDDPFYRKNVIEKTQHVLDEYRQRTGETFLAGWTITNFYLSQYMKKDIHTFIPVTYFFITLAVFLFFRNFWLTLAALLNISICMGSTMGLFPLFGITLNNVTTIVPPVVMALALCDTVHIFTHLDNRILIKAKNSEAAMVLVLKKVFWPCFLTTLTTAVGFISLYLSDIPPIKEFALLASAGMIYEFFYTFFFLPALLLFLKPEKIFSHKKSNFTGMKIFLDGCYRLILQHSKAITMITIFLLAVSVMFALKIKVETNLLDYFHPKDIVRQSVDFVEQNIAGIRTVDISFHSQVENGFKMPENLHIVDQVQHFVQSVQSVDKALSFIDFLKDMNQSFHNGDAQYYSIPESKNLITQYLLLYDFDDIDEFVNESYDYARISIRTHAHLTSEQARIINEIRQYLQSMDLNGLEAQVTGRAVLHVNTIDALVSGQIKSLVMASAIISLLLVLVLKSLKLGLLSILPNFFPIVINFGIMGLFNIPLNTATALISAVAIGIAVDDTIHFMTRYKELRDQKHDIPNCIERVILEKGKAILLSSLILTIGFGTMITSLFTPTFHFGVLSATIMITAVVGDLFVLPSILILYSQLKK